MAIRTDEQLRTLYFTDSGIWPDNVVGDITPADLRSGVLDTYDTLVDGSGFINHYNLINIGNNTHDQIDTHIASGDIHFLQNDIDHSVLQNLEWSSGNHTIDTDVDFNNNAATNVNYIDFNLLSSGVAHAEGRLHWNEDDGTLEICMPGGNVIIQLGQETTIMATNDEVSTITNGTLVYISSGSGGFAKVKIADNTDFSNLAGKTMAVATEDVSTSQKGYFTVFGLVRDVNTSDCTAGDLLYLGNSGVFTNIKPSSPDYVVQIGMCIRSHATEGVILTRIQSMTYERAFAVCGSLTGFEKSDSGEPPTDSVLMYDSELRTISIEPSGTHYNYWLRGEKYQVDAPLTGIHPDTTASYFFYWDKNNDLQFNTTPWDIFEDVPISYVYYNSSIASGFFFEERHGSDTNKAWHYSQHYRVGTFWHQGEGLTLDNYTLSPSSPADVDNQFTTDAGVIHDEDIAFQVPVSTSGQYDIMYRTGADGDWTWQIKEVPVLDSGSYMYWNEFAGGSWQLATGTNNDYINMYVFTTSALSNGDSTFMVMGQTIYQTLAGAQAETASELIFGDFPFQEVLSLYKITFRMNASYSSQGKCRIEAVDDTRLSTSRNIISAAPSTNHNSLAGLQGGTSSEYYHLTSAQHTGLTAGGSADGYHTHTEFLHDVGISGNITTSGNIYLASDIFKSYYGESNDSSITYDGTNMVFNSQEIGPGDFVFENGAVGIGAVPSDGLLHATITSADSETYCLKLESTDSGKNCQMRMFNNAGESASFSINRGSLGDSGDVIFQTEEANNINFRPNRDSYSTFAMRFTSNQDVQIPQNNKKLYFGATQEASITYDGTDLIIDPDEVGAGIVKIGATGDGYIQAYRYGAGSNSPSSNIIFTGNTGTYTEDTSLFGLNLQLNRTPSVNGSNDLMSMYVRATADGTKDIRDFYGFNSIQYCKLNGSSYRNIRGLNFTYSFTNTGTANTWGGIVVAVTGGGSVSTTGDAFAISIPDYTTHITAGGTAYGIRQLGSSLVNYFEGDVQIASNSSKLYLGASQNASITYDGTDMVFNSQEIGPGDFIFSNGNVILTSGYVDSKTYYYFNGTKYISVDGTNIISFGSNNTVGHSGSRSIYMGNDSGGSLGAGLSENDNYVFAHQSMQVATTAKQNIAIGTQTLQNITIGFGDVAIGHGAGLNITEANGCFALGRLSLGSLEDGDFNVGIGNGALGSIVSTAGSVGIGNNAGTNATGWQNTIVGGDAGPNQTTGDNNLIMGYSSAKKKTGGDTNVILGANTMAGGANRGIAGCVWIGSQTGYYETGSNTFFVDNTNRSSEADARIKALMYGNFNASTASQLLRVNAEMELCQDDLYMKWGAAGDAGIRYTTAGNFEFDSQLVGSGDFIFSNGAVGINTSTPNIALEVKGLDANGQARFTRDIADDQYGEIKAGGNLFNFISANEGTSTFIQQFAFIQRHTSADNEVMRIDENGSVGIGTSDPSYKLSLYESSSAGVYTHYTNVTTGETTSDGSIIGITSAGNLTIQNQEYSGDVEISSPAGNILLTSVLGVGNVGIGKTPTEVLDVAGAIARQGFLYLYNVGSQTIGATDTNINWDTQGRIDTDYYTHSTSTNPHEITFDVAGDYRISIQGTGANTGSTARRQVGWNIHVDTGGGYGFMNGSNAYTYHRTNAGAGFNTGAIDLIYTASAGDKIKLVSNSTHATDVVTVIHGCRCTIEKI